MADSAVRSVLVTGASGGIGQATVRALTAAGFRVYAGVRGDAARFAGGPGSYPVRLDVTDPQSVDAAAQQVAELTGAAGLHAVINNAGVIVQGPLELIPPAELERQFAVNTLGPMHVARAFLSLIRNGRGRMINISAPTAWLPMPFSTIGASKAALESLSASLRIELAPWRIPVIMVHPSVTRTAIFERADQAAERALSAVAPHRVALYRSQLDAVAAALREQRTIDPEQVARAIVRAVAASRPRRWYAASPEVRLLRLVSRLPAGLRDALVSRILGLTKINTAAPRVDLEAAA